MTSTVTRSLDWKTVRELQDECTRLLTEREAVSARELDEPARRALAESVVVGHVGQHARQLVREGKGTITPTDERALVDAVLASMFGLGRLEPLLHDGEIEDIEISGYDTVTVTDFRGEVRRVMFTAQDPQTIREAFERAKPNEDYARLYAAAVARRHAAPGRRVRHGAPLPHRVV